MKLNWFKYAALFVAFAMLISFGVVSSNYVEKVGSQMIAQNATQQFNENVNAYSQISTDSGLKDVVLIAITSVEFLLTCFGFYILYSFVKKDYKLFKGGKNEEN